MDGTEVVSRIKRKFQLVGSPASIPMQRGGSFTAELTPDGVKVDNLGVQPFLPWIVFQEAVCVMIRNGMALCRLCHWTFDEGMTAVSTKYRVMLSKELRMIENTPGHLLTVENRQILGPSEENLWPNQAALKWHRHKVFLKG